MSVERQKVSKLKKWVIYRASVVPELACNLLSIRIAKSLMETCMVKFIKSIHVSVGFEVWVENCVHDAYGLSSRNTIPTVL